MALAYQVRLFSLCLAVFFLVHTACGLLVAALAPVLVRRAERCVPRLGVRLLLVARLAPPLVALFAVAALCVPSYVSFEPGRTPEQVGRMFLVLAGLGLTLCVLAAGRGLHALLGSRRYRRLCERQGRPVQVRGEAMPLLVVADGEPAPPLFLAGVFQPRLIASRALLGALTPEQLEVAVRHERAHVDVHDNLKRLLLTLAPGLAPGWNGFGAIERGWARLVEWAADDRAVDGDSRRSVSLAGALVCAARLHTAPIPRSPMMAQLLFEPHELAARVNRLLAPARPPHAAGRRMAWLLPSATVLPLAAMALFRPATMVAVHVLLERLIH